MTLTKAEGVAGSRGLVPAAVLMGLVLSIVACSGRPDTLQDIHDRGAFYIGLDPSYPPFEALAPDGELYGLDVDLGRELAGRLGVESHFVLIGYDGLYDALLVGQVDVLISAMVVDPGRMDDVAYSTVYFDSGLVLVVPADAAEDVTDMRDLAGGVVAVEYAAEGDVEARRWARQLTDLSVLPSETADEALAAVSSGAADAALVDGISGRLYVREHVGVTLSTSLVTSTPYAVVVRADDRPLLRAIDAALESMEADSALDTIIDDYF